MKILAGRWGSRAGEPLQERPAKIARFPLAATPPRPIILNGQRPTTSHILLQLPADDHRFFAHLLLLPANIGLSCDTLPTPHDLARVAC